MGRWGMSLFMYRSGDVICSGFWILDPAAVMLHTAPHRALPRLGTGHVENGIGPFRRRANRLDRRRLVAPVAQHSRHAFARTLLVDQILERDGIQVLDHFLIQRRPQFMRHAVAVVLFGAL